MAKYNKLGVLGGMGPLATVTFYKKVIDLTNARTDQENIDMVILNDTKVPDRTEYLLDNSKPNPLKYLKKDIDDLNKLGCDLICLPCNTAHYFYNDLEKYSKIKILNMVDLVLKECIYEGYKNVVLFGTIGTINSHVYEKFNKYGINLIIPDLDKQEIIESFIYDYVKKNRRVPKSSFLKLINSFYDEGADAIILGCTELSVINDDLMLNDDRLIDSTNVLASEVVKLCKE